MVGLRNCALLLMVFALPLAASAQKISPPAAAAPAEKPAKKLARPKPKPEAPTPAGESSVLFEGYLKVLLGGVHVGYAIQRYEFDGKKKEFVSTTFLKTNALAGNVTESLKARADSGFKPVSYQYTELVGSKAKTIDAAFSKNTMTAVVKDGDKPTTTVRKDLPKGTFPSTFLAYMMLNAKEGLKPGVRYAFNAIAEEDAGVYPGEAYIAAQENYNGFPAFKIYNTFKGSKFGSHVTLKGETLATRAPVQGIATELVPSIQEATAGQSVNSAMLTTLFGRVPDGKANVVARRAATAPAIVPLPTPLPTSDVPPDATKSDPSAASPTPAETSVAEPKSKEE